MRPPLFKKYQRGDRASAKHINAVADVARQTAFSIFNKGASDSGGMAGHIARLKKSSTIIKVLNNSTGADKADIKVGTFVEVTDYDEERDLFAGVVPTADAVPFGRIAIALENIEYADGGSQAEFGFCAIGGVRQLTGLSTQDFVVGSGVGTKEGTGEAQLQDNGPWMVVGVEEDTKNLSVRPTGGGVGGRTLARITQTISRGDPFNTTGGEPDPIPEVRQYKAAIIGGAETPLWSPLNVEYEQAFIVRHDEKFWSATESHISSATKEPGISQLWEETVEGIEVYLDGVPFFSSTDFPNFQYTLENVPWFPVGYIVQVYQRQKFTAAGVPFGDYLWFICGPFIRVEYVTPTEKKFSCYWNESENRLMAVFG